MSKNKKNELDKELYSFIVYKKEKVDKAEESVNENGEKVTITKTVEEEVPITVVFKRPSRKIQDEANMEAAAKMSQCIKRGILTKAMLSKKYSDTGGVLSEVEAREHSARYNRLNELQVEFINLAVSKKEADIKRQEEVNKELNELRREIAEVETNYSVLFDQTADTITLKHKMLFYTLFLTAIKNEDGELYDYFEGYDFEEKLEDFYKKEESDDIIYREVRLKMSYFVSFWENGLASSKEQFEKLEKDIDSGRV